MLTKLSLGPNDKVEKSNGLVVLIVDNMYKIVKDPGAIIPVIPRLEPLVKAASEEMSNPEARNLAERALKLWHPWPSACNFCTNRGNTGLSCDASSALTWTQRQSGKSNELVV